jgi:hypothetical protein
MELVTFRHGRKVSDHRPIVVAPLGDMQWAGPRGSTALDPLKRHIERCLEMDALFIGMGDYIDFMSPSNRQRMRAAALYDTAEDVIDDKAMDLVQDIFDKALRPTKGRWLGLLEGHHFSTLKTGETTDQRLCQMLGARFLGTTALVRLQVVTNGTVGNVVFWAHHGTGGGQKLAAPLNKLENLTPYWQGVDVFLQGHTTKSPAVPMNTVIPRWHGHGAPDLVHKKTYLVSTGGFSKAYQVGSMQGRVPRGDYAEQRMLNPAVIGAPIIRIVPGMKFKNRAGGGQSKTWAPEITVEL